MIFSSASNTTTASQGYINFPVITAPYSFWMVSGSDQNMLIIVSIYADATSSIQYSINKLNATTPQDPAIKQLQDQVAAMSNNITTLQTQVTSLTNDINNLNTTINSMNKTQQQMLDNISDLWAAYNSLNTSLAELQNELAKINQTNSQDIAQFNESITRLETNITNIEQNLSQLNSYVLRQYLSLYNMSQMTISHVHDLEYIVDLLSYNITASYNDTALKNQIAQLQKENAQLKANIDTLNHTKSEKTIKKEADNTIGVLAVGISIVALMMVLLLFNLCMIQLKAMNAKWKNASKDSSQPVSDDYEDADETPKHISKAKASKAQTLDDKNNENDEEELDDVMKKLKDDD